MEPAAQRISRPDLVKFFDPKIHALEGVYSALKIYERLSREHDVCKFLWNLNWHSDTKTGSVAYFIGRPKTPLSTISMLFSESILRRNHPALAVRGGGVLSDAADCCDSSTLGWEPFDNRGHYPNYPIGWNRLAGAFINPLYYMFQGNVDYNLAMYNESAAYRVDLDE